MGGHLDGFSGRNRCVPLGHKARDMSSFQQLKMICDRELPIVIWSLRIFCWIVMAMMGLDPSLRSAILATQRSVPPQTSALCCFQCSQSLALSSTAWLGTAAPVMLSLSIAAAWDEFFGQIRSGNSSLHGKALHVNRSTHPEVVQRCCHVFSCLFNVSSLLAGEWTYMTTSLLYFRAAE